MGKSVDILEQLLTLNPSDQFVRSELGWSEQYYGAICRTEGNLEEAMKYGLRSVAT